MGIRQTLNENPSMSIAITGGVILLALAFILWEIFGGRGATPAAGAGKAFYSDDDGKTFFTDDATKITPFTDSNGKIAVQAVVFRCNGGSPFVGYLQRYTEQGKQEAQKLLNEQHGTVRSLRIAISRGSGLVEVKKPGAPQWVKWSRDNPNAYNDIITPTCPDGSKNGLEMVMPGSQ